MFDRNTVIAFILIVAIFIVWQLWWVKTAPQPQPVPVVADTLATDTLRHAVTEPFEGIKLNILDSADIIEYDTIPERRIEIVTDLYQAILSNRGGGIIQLQLKKFRHADSSRVNLIPQGSQATPTLLSYGRNFSDKKLTYTVTCDSLLQASGPQTQIVTFTVNVYGKGQIVKEFVFYGDKYNFDVNLTINGAQQLGLEREYVLAWLPAIPPSETNLQDDYSSYKGGVYLSGEMYKIEKFEQNRLKDDPSGSAQWAGSRSKYFAYAIIPKENLSTGASFRGEKSSETIAGLTHERRAISAGIVMPLGSQDNVTNKFTIFAGPLDSRILKTYGVNLEDFIDWGWKIIRPFSYAVYWLVYQLHRIIPNYGFVIILAAILMKLVTYPLTKKSLMSMQAMKRLQPKMEELKVKFKSDPQKLNAAMMKLYKDEKVNPFGSCLLMLPQMPLMFGLYQVFRSTIEFRQAYFLGYWPDISQPDPMPWVMPIIMTIAMFIQQKMSVTDPKQKMMVYIMPVIFFFMMKSLPVGLVLYWTCYSVLSIFETLNIQRQTAQMNPQVK
jgi:YidC/Oxa1 family membrane protein insertase